MISPAAPSGPPSAVVDVLAPDMAALSHAPLEVKRWINSALSHLLPDGPKADTAATEEAVHRLHGRVQGHAQAVGNEVEDIIGQTVVRLPRTSLELTRMVSDVQELHEQLQGINNVVQPAHEADGSEAHTQELNNLKLVQTRLQRCSDILAQASTVDANMHAVERVVHQLKTTSGNNNKSNIDSVAAVGHTIRELQRDLRILRQADPSYGEKHTVALEEYEHVVEQVLEQQCLEQLARHQAAEAAALFAPLSLIGRADTVLRNYAVQVTDPCISLMKEKLSSAGASSSSEQLTISVASALRNDVIPAAHKCLASEMEFLTALSDCLADKGPSSSVAQKKDIQKETEGAADSPTVAEAAVPPSQRAMQAIEEVIQLLGDAFKSCMLPLLVNMHDTTGLISAYETVVQQLAPTRSAELTSDATVQHIRKEKAAAQASAHALSAFVAVFHDSAVLQIFSEQTNQRLQRFTNRQLFLFKQPPLLKGLAVAISENVRDVLRFAPDHSTDPCVQLWQASLMELVAHLSPSSNRPAGTPHPESTEKLLELLCLASIVAEPAFLQARKDVEAMLLSADVQQRHPASAGQLSSTMDERVWRPLTSALAAAIVDCQAAVQRCLLRSVLDKSAHYGELPVWGNAAGQRTTPASSSNMGPLATYTHSHVTPSQPARELGEAIIEIPLSLESLRVTDASTTVGLDGVESLLEEVSETWLDQMVRVAVDDFIDKVLSIRIDFAVPPVPTGSKLPAQADSANAKTKALESVATAWEQLTTDVDYLKNVLSAVSEEQFDRLEKVLDAVRALPPPAPTDSLSFIVGERLNQTALQQVA